MTDEESDAVAAAYLDRRARLLPTMPPPVRELATEVDIHDGLIQRAVFDRSAASLRLEFICGDLQRGYFDLRLVYARASFDSAALAVIASDPQSEALYDEVDVNADSTFEHRILFWPYREITICFSSLSLARVARPDRKRVELTERFFERV